MKNSIKTLVTWLLIGIIFIVSSIIVSIFVNKKEITDKNMTINEKSFQKFDTLLELQDYVKTIDGFEMHY